MSTLILKPENKVLHIKLNRPTVHNAFNPEMIQELTSVFSDIKDLSQYHAVVLRGEGPSFCSGGDLNWMKSMVKYTFDENLKDANQLFEMFEVLKNCPVPLIGLVHGNIFGGGLGLVAVCDIVYAEENSKFCFSETKLGLAPAVITPFVKRKVASHYLREVMFSADIFGVHRALDMGLVHFFGSTEQMYKELDAKVSLLSKCGREAVHVTKKLLNDLEPLSWEDSKKYVTRTISERRISAEGQERLKAFLDKNK